MSYIVIKQLKIANANALSSTCTVGVPSMTAWLGFMYALERKLHDVVDSYNGEKLFENAKLKSIGVSYIDTNLRAYKIAGKNSYSIIGSKNPSEESNGKPASFIETPSVDLTVSLVIEATGIAENESLIPETVATFLMKMKVAGGDVRSIGYYKKEKKRKKEKEKEPSIFEIACKNVSINEDEAEVKKLLMPGFVIVERRDLLENTKDLAINELLDILALQCHSIKDEENRINGWKYSKKEKGWLVPIGVGYKGLSPLGKVKNQRNANYMHRFVEGIITLGEFKMPMSFENITDFMWHYEYDEKEAYYLCRNQKQNDPNF